MIGSAVVPTRYVSGVALILGSVLFLTGAGVYMFVRDKRGPMIFGQPPGEWLRLVAGHPRLWRWATLLFITGVLMTLLGQLELTELLLAAGDPGFALPALLATTIGAVLWIIHLAKRLAVDPWAGSELSRTGAVSDVYVALGRLVGILFVIYTILTFAGLSAFGAALVATTLLPQWTGWVAAIYGVAGLVLLAATRDAPPFLHYVLPLLFGILLLVQ